MTDSNITVLSVLGAENLGFKVDWDADTQTITLTYPDPEK